VRADLRDLSARYVDLSLDLPPWVKVGRVRNQQHVESLLLHLHPGEAEAIALAVETTPDFLLLDERRGRKIAKRLGVRCIGVLGTLAEAKRLGLVPAVRPLLDALIHQAGFWVKPNLRDHVLSQVKELP
jgi:predicted nucleic acid-binding protein